MKCKVGGVEIPFKIDPTLSIVRSFASITQSILTVALSTFNNRVPAGSS